LAKKPERKYLFSYLKGRFGIGEEVFDHYLIYKKKKSWWILRESDFIQKAHTLKSRIIGLKAFQEISTYLKPTTRFIQVFGHNANKAVYSINAKDLKLLLSGEPLHADPLIDNGYVILRFEGSSLGLGLLINGKIKSQIPKKDLINYI